MQSLIMNKIFLSIFLIFFFAESSIAQSSGSTLELATFLKAKKRVKDPIITVFDQNGQKVEIKTGTTEGGRVLLYFPFNNSYKVVIEREGYVTINFTVNTQLPSNEKAENMSSDLDLKMIEQPLDGSKENIEKPVAKVNYIEKIGMFDYDWDYDDEVTEELRELEKKIREKDKNFEKEQKLKEEELATAEFEKKKKEEEAKKAAAEAEKERALLAAEEEKRKAENHHPQYEIRYFWCFNQIIDGTGTDFALDLAG